MRPNHQLLTTRQFADSLGVSESSIKRWVDDGSIVAERTAGGHRRIPVSSAVRFLRERRIQPHRPQALLPQAPALGCVDEASADTFYSALLNDEPATARSLIRGRYLSGASVAEIADGLVRPVLGRIGELWKHDPRGVLVEHRSVQYCMQVLLEIDSWISEPARRAPIAITAAGPDDPYALPCLLASMTLRESGVRTVHLGPATPFPTIELAVSQYSATLCALSFSTPLAAPAASQWRAFQRRIAASACRLVVGGRGVNVVHEHSPSRAQRSSAHIAASMTELAAFARGLSAAPSVSAPAPHRRISERRS